MTSPMVDRRFGLVGNAAIKAPVLAVATTNIALSGEQTIDSVAVHAVNAAGIPDRVLVAGQTDATQNGIYDVSTSAWSRSPDADGPYDLRQGSMVNVAQGTVYNKTVWSLTTADPITIGTTALAWVVQTSQIVAASIANVNTVAGSIANVNTVAGSIANVNTVAGSIANVNTVAGDKANIDIVAADKANIDAVVANLATINSAITASATSGVYPTAAASNVPQGLTQASVGAITAGAGGTNGTFALGFSAGTGWLVYPTGTFTVAGNVLTAVNITGPGLCISAAPVVPTVSFAASAGLAGSAVALTMQFLVTAGQGYWVSSTNGGRLDRYKNVAGVATRDTGVASIPTSLTTDLAMSPRDPVALWAIDEYISGTNPYIPNMASTSLVVSSNLKRARRRAFNSLFYFRTNVTVLDNSADGLVAGVQDAAILTCTGNWKLLMGAADNWPAGTYTVVLTVMRNGGSDQPISFTKDNGFSRMAPQTATSAFQRLAFTFTLGGATPQASIAMCSTDGVTGANLILESCEVFSGASDPGRTSDDGHIYVGRSHGSTPSYANGILSDSASNAAAALLTQKYAMTKWSVSYLVEVASRPGTTSPVISDLNHDPSTPFTSFQNWAAQVEGNPSTPANSPMAATLNGAMRNQIGASSGIAQFGGFFNFVGKNYHLHTRTYDGVGEELWVDDVRMFRYEHAITARNLRDFLLFVDNNAGGSGLNYAGLIGLWDRTLSAAEIRQFFSYQRARNPALTIPGLRSLRVLAVEGDSNHGGQTNTCWPWLFAVNDAPENIGSVWAVIGSMLVDLNARASQLDASIPPDQFERKFILTVADGTNDLANYSSTAQFITDLRAYCNARVAAGWQLCLFTLPPVDGDATFNGRRATVNADIRANWALYGLASSGRIIDIASDAIIGPDNSRTVNPTYWADTKHFSATGNAVVETYARAVINAI